MLKLRLPEAIQRAREIQDAAEGNTIPGDPDHGRWGRAPHGGPVMAQPAGYQGHQPSPPSPSETAPGFNLPQRPLPPIAASPDNLNNFAKNRGIPARRVIPPRSL